VVYCVFLLGLLVHQARDQRLLLFDDLAQFHVLLGVSGDEIVQFELDVEGWFVAGFDHDEGKVFFIFDLNYFLADVYQEFVECAQVGDGNVLFVEYFFDLSSQGVEDVLDLEVDGCLANVNLLPLFADLEVFVYLLANNEVAEVDDALVRFVLWEGGRLELFEVLVLVGFVEDEFGGDDLLFILLALGLVLLKAGGFGFGFCIAQFFVLGVDVLAEHDLLFFFLGFFPDHGAAHGMAFAVFVVDNHDQLFLLGSALRQSAFVFHCYLLVAFLQVQYFVAHFRVLVPEFVEVGLETS
jgi:hypothetical protein